MNKHKLKTIIISGLSLIIIFSCSNFSLAYNFKTDSGLNTTGETAGFDTGPTATGVDSLIGTIIYAGLSLVGVAFFSLILYGAYNWMTSRGNEEKVKQATSTIINAIVGLIVTLGAYAVSYFLIEYFQL